MPQIALLIYFVLLWWLFRKDRQIRTLPSLALWIPALWLFVLGSKSPAQWLNDLGVGVYSSDDKGSVDQIVFATLVIAAVFALIARRMDWKRFALSNKALILMYVFWFLSCLWAPNASASSKRLFKDFGCVLVGLVFLTEQKPWLAIKTVFVRLAYVILPLSLVLAKYFPLLGRSASRSGETMYVGVATHKNTMGVIALVLGLFILADLLEMRRSESGGRPVDRYVRYLMLFLCAWLLLIIDSQTSLLCFTLGFFMFLGTGRLATLKNPGQVLVRCVVALVFIVTIDGVFGLSSFIIQDVLGRDTTLTGRTEIWADVRAAGTDPVRGVGFYSFWETPPALKISARFPGGMKTAHNGFLETYLDGGYAGVSALVLMLLSWLQRAIRRTLSGTISGQLLLVVWVIAVIYNYSETSFFRLEPLWFTLLLFTTQYEHAAQEQHTGRRSSAEAFVGNPGDATAARRPARVVRYRLRQRAG